MANRLETPHDFGAESIIYLGSFLGKKVVVKYRVAKPYRDVFFDKLFRESRTRTEAKILLDLSTNGLNVPKPLAVDLENSILIIEYIEGTRMDHLITKIDDYGLKKYGYQLGVQVGKMHSLSIYHGDLTLANVIVSHRDEVYLIDFGLAGYSSDVEEYAIDLHLLKRSVEALAPIRAIAFINSFIEGYRATYNKDPEHVLARLREVELRGRYVDAKIRRELRRDRYVE